MMAKAWDLGEAVCVCMIASFLGVTAWLFCQHHSLKVKHHSDRNHAPCLIWLCLQREQFVFALHQWAHRQLCAPLSARVFVSGCVLSKYLSFFFSCLQCMVRVFVCVCVNAICLCA